MIEITNLKKFPVQLIIKSKKRTKQFTVLNLPALGKEKNIYHLEDERCTEYIDRAEKDGLITTRRIPNILNEGEK
ncbi:MAG: hypothetical protein EBX77_03930 [Actinobacteria bacterium]|jgi:hypothetical protein|nr:hypothetical protein [Actinomycetota bacterium]